MSVIIGGQLHCAVRKARSMSQWRQRLSAERTCKGGPVLELIQIAEGEQRPCRPANESPSLACSTVASPHQPNNMLAALRWQHAHCNSLKQTTKGFRRSLSVPQWKHRWYLPCLQGSVHASRADNTVANAACSASHSRLPNATCGLKGTQVRRHLRHILLPGCSSYSHQLGLLS